MQLQTVAGSLAGMIFAAASWNMLMKAWQTKDLKSYSLGQIVLTNIGNLLYWLYVLSLPFGPIWFMHAFYTLASLLMLVWYVVYQGLPNLRQQPCGAARFRPMLIKRLLGSEQPRCSGD